LNETRDGFSGGLDRFKEIRISITLTHYVRILFVLDFLYFFFIRTRKSCSIHVVREKEREREVLPRDLCCHPLRLPGIITVIFRRRTVLSMLDEFTTEIYFRSDDPEMRSCHIRTKEKYDEDLYDWRVTLRK
jgi:hypothetical protein